MLLYSKLVAIRLAGADDRVRTAAGTICQALIDADLTAFIGARTTGTRSAPLSATALGSGCWRSAPRAAPMAGDLELRIPKLRTGSFFPSLLKR